MNLNLVNEFNIESLEYIKLLNQPRSVMFSIYVATDIIGLDDMIKDHRNLFSVKCIAMEGEIFKISLKVK